MKTCTQPARAAFSTKRGIRVAAVSTCIMKLIAMPSSSPQRDEAVEDRLPLRVAREVVVGEEVVPDAGLRPQPVVRADVIDDLRRAAAAHVVALHVDDRAERAVERAAAARVDRAVVVRGELVLQARRDLRQRPSREIRQVLQEVVERPQPAGRRVLQQGGPAILDFAQDERDALVDHGLTLRRDRRGAIATDPLTWNPPIITSKPSALNWRARSCARGN